MRGRIVFIVFTGLNIVALFLALNPWMAHWRDQAILVLILETIFFCLIGVPVVWYQMKVKKKSFKKSLTDGVDTVLDFLAGFP